MKSKQIISLLLIIILLLSMGFHTSGTSSTEPFNDVATTRSQHLLEGAWHRQVYGNIVVNEWFQFYAEGVVRQYHDVTWLGVTADDVERPGGDIIENDRSEYIVRHYTVRDDGLVCIQADPLNEYSETEYYQLQIGTAHEDTKLSDLNNDFLAPYTGVAALYADEPVDTDLDLRDQNPLIFIPGIMGSRLYAADNTPLWPPSIDASTNTDITLDMHSNPDPLIVHNLDVDQSTLTPGSREYGPSNVYKPVIDHLCDHLTERRPVYYFSYDWRQSPLVSAAALDAFISYVAQQHHLDGEQGRIDLIAHSMGGLVVSAFMKMHAHDNGQRIGKIITAGTPYEGSPAMLDVTMSERILYRRTEGEHTKEGWLAYSRDLLINSMIDLSPEVKRSLHSTYALVPSLEYVTIYPFLVTDPNPGCETWCAQLGEMTYERFLQRLFAPTADVLELHRWFKQDQDGNDLDFAGKRINYLATLPNTYFIIGTGQKTIESFTIERAYSEDCLFVSGDAASIVDEGDKPHGDGTVPYASATMMGALPLLLRGQKCRLFLVGANHNDTINGDKSLAWINKLLNRE